VTLATLEFHLRKLGEADREAYLQRFPNHGEQLRQRLATPVEYPKTSTSVFTEPQTEQFTPPQTSETSDVRQTLSASAGETSAEEPDSVGPTIPG
jgi:hypothetical protein